MSSIALFFGGTPGLILALSTLIIAFVRHGILPCSVALISNVLVSRMVHINTLPEGQPAGPFRPMFAAAGYTAVAGALYLNLFPLPFGHVFAPYNFITIPFVFISIIGIHYVDRLRHDARLNDFSAKGSKWLSEDVNVAEVKRGFICLGVTGTMWSMVFSAWALKFSLDREPFALGFEASSLHLAVLFALYLLPWLCFSWWVREKAVQRGIYAGFGITIAAAPLAYSCYYLSLTEKDWWRMFLPPGSHIAAIAVFVLIGFLIWWIRQSASTTGRGILSGFFAAAIPAILLLSGAFLTLFWHPAARQFSMMAYSPDTALTATYLLSSRLALFGVVPLIIVLLFATFGGLRAGISSKEIEDDPVSENDSVSAAGSQTLTVLLFSLPLAALFTYFLSQIAPMGVQVAMGNKLAHIIPINLLSWFGYLPLMLINVFIFGGLWVNGRYIAQASRLPHPRMAGAVLFLLQAVIIWGFDPSRQLLAAFILAMAGFLMLQMIFGSAMPEVRRSLLDYQRFVIWSCFLGMPVVFLAGIATVLIPIELKQLISLFEPLSTVHLGIPAPYLLDNLRPEAFWAAPIALSAGLGLIALLAIPLLSLPLYLYPIFKDRKAAETP